MMQNTYIIFAKRPNAPEPCPVEVYSQEDFDMMPGIVSAAVARLSQDPSYEGCEFAVAHFLLSGKRIDRAFSERSSGAFIQETAPAPEEPSWPQEGTPEWQAMMN